MDIKICGVLQKNEENLKTERKHGLGKKKRNGVEKSRKLSNEPFFVIKKEKYLQKIKKKRLTKSASKVILTHERGKEQNIRYVISV